MMERFAGIVFKGVSSMMSERNVRTEVTWRKSTTLHQADGFNGHVIRADQAAPGLGE